MNSSPCFPIDTITSTPNIQNQANLPTGEQKAVIPCQTAYSVKALTCSAFVSPLTPNTVSLILISVALTIPGRIPLPSPASRVH